MAPLSCGTAGDQFSLPYACKTQQTTRLWNERGSVFCCTRLVLMLHVQAGCFTQRPTSHHMNIKFKTPLHASVMENSFYCIEL